MRTFVQTKTFNSLNVCDSFNLDHMYVSTGVSLFVSVNFVKLIRLIFFGSVGAPSRLVGACIL